MKPTRRQLLKGSLAAPLVLTARSASAWALTSAAACKFRDGDKAEHDQYIEKLCHQPYDEWLRCDVDLCKLKIYDKKHHKWVTLDGDHYLGADKVTYWKVHDSYGKLTAEKTSHTVSNCSYTKTGVKKYGICYVNEDCDQVGYCWESYGGKCITKSCWWSIKHSKWG
jgi:hypothetical protein